MNSGHHNTGTEAGLDPPACDAGVRGARFNALEVLARLPDLSRDQPLPYSRSSRRHKKRPREIPLRLLGGSVVGLFVLAIASAYFWGGSGETSSLPEKAATSFESGSDAISSDPGVQPGNLDITPIARDDQDGAAMSDMSAGPVAPLDAQEFEKARGVVTTEDRAADSSVASLQPFVVGEEASNEPIEATEPVPAPRRPLAPRFEDTVVAPAAPGNATPWNPGIAPGNSNTLGEAALDTAPSTDFTPWQPGMAAHREPAYPGANHPQPPRVEAEPAYTPWSGSGGPAPRTEGPAPRGPAYTAMNPNPSPAPAAPSGRPPYQNPSPVWNPGNPYATPDSAPGPNLPARTPLGAR